MKRNAMTCFPLVPVLGVWAYIAQGRLVSPKKKSNMTTPAKVNATTPLEAQEHIHQNDADQYYYYMKNQIKKNANHSAPSDPLVETRVGCRTPLCIGQVDTLVLIDVSGSVSENDFKKIQDMLLKFPHHFQRGQFLALMSYGEYPKILTQWTDSAENFKSAAMNMELGWSAGDLGAGLARATQLLRYAGDRSYHNVLVITDGGSTSRMKAKQAAEMVGQSGGVIYMVVVEEFSGAGPVFDEGFEVVQAAGQYPANEYILSVDRYDDLVKDDYIGQMVYMLCPQVMTLLSTGSKMVRTIVDGNRTATTRRKKLQRNFRKTQTRSSKRDASSI